MRGGVSRGASVPPNRPAVIAPGREVIEAIDDAIERGDLVPEDVDASAWDALHVTHPQIAARAFFSLRRGGRRGGPRGGGGGVVVARFVVDAA